MKSLYDLLGARADDDAEALRKAFRNTVKAHHPDLHPRDPGAPLRFTQIVAAYALLSDATQRANYDRQLEHDREQRWRMCATVAIAAVGALVGGYGLGALVGEHGPFSHMFKNAIVESSKDEHTAAPVARVKRDRQTATVEAAERR